MSREVMQQALDALEWVNDNTTDEMPIVDAALFDLRAELAKPAAVPARVVASLQKKADDYYCASLDKARQPECLGWEKKVKDGTFGAREMFAHGERNNLDGRHRGIYEALRILAASPQPTAPAVSPVDVEAVREVITEMKRERRSTDDDYYHDVCGKKAEEWADQLARAIGETP